MISPTGNGIFSAKLALMGLAPGLSTTICVLLNAAWYETICGTTSEVRRWSPHQDGLSRTGGYALHAACTLRNKHGKDHPVPGQHAGRSSLTRIGSEHLLRAPIQTQATVERVATSLCVDLYLHGSFSSYHGNLAYAVLDFNVMAPCSQTARQTPQP